MVSVSGARNLVCVCVVRVCGVCVCVCVVRVCVCGACVYVWVVLVCVDKHGGERKMAARRTLLDHAVFMVNHQSTGWTLFFLALACDVHCENEKKCVHII